MTKRNNSFHPAAALLIFSSITVSCITTDKSLGENFVPDNQLLNVSTMQLEVPVQMKMGDSLQTFYPGYLTVGSYNDDVLGSTIAGTAFQVIPSIKENDYGENPVPSKLRMTMTVSQNMVLEASQTSIPQNIYLYSLKKDIDSTTIYNNSISMADVDPTPINTGGTVYFGGDSIVMNLNLDYAKKLLSTTQDERDSADVFTKKFKGFYMTTAPISGNLNGGRFSLIDPSSIYLEMTYRHIDTDNSINKDSSVFYYVSTSRPYMNTYSHSSKKLETKKSGEKIYIEGLAGIKPYIDFSEVKTKMAEWATSKGTSISKIIIARAELRFPYEFPSDYLTMGQFPSQIFLNTKDDDNKFDLPLYQPTSDIYVLSTGKNNRSFFYYTMDISSYFQKVLNGQYTGKKLQTWISPITSSTSSYTGTTTYSVDNLIYSKATLNGNQAERKPYLVITYTIAK